LQNALKNVTIFPQSERTDKTKGVIIMVKVIMGLKGSGKTKQMVDKINAAVESEAGHIVCIEKGSKLVYDIKSSVRLVEASDYPIGGYSYLQGFVSGLHAGDYDITHIFIDSLYKIAVSDDTAQAEAFLSWCDEFGKANKIDFTVSISADVSTATEGIQKFF
jgi:hypothetical protein